FLRRPGPYHRMRRALIVWGVCFASCSLAAFHDGFEKRVWSDGREPKTNFLDLAWSADRVDQTFSTADLARYIVAGKKVLIQGRFESGFVKFWPPGMPIIIAGVLGVSGGDAY